MKKSTFVLIAALTAGPALPGTIPDGWLTVIDSNAASRVYADYANNILRCTWAGDTTKVAATLPANAAFQLAVAGPEDCIPTIRDALEETAAAIPTNLTPVIRRFHLLGPTLQWIVRSVKCKKPNRADYLWASTHPAAFSDLDFNIQDLLNFARHVTAAQLPPAVVIRLDGEETADRQSLTAAIPGVDYPGIHPELTFATPFGIGMVVRAPESSRIFRVRAAAFPASNAPVSYTWSVLTGGAQVQSWNREKPTKDGYGRIILNVGTLCAKGRVDVAVFARWGEGPWGAPSIISFYASPYEIRTYKKNVLESIRYLPDPKNPPPFDISRICLPAEWADNYRSDDENRIIGFSRLLPDGITSDDFSILNERIIESHPNGTPKTARKIRYFAKDGRLRYEETEEEISYKLKTFQPRRYGK